MSSYLLDYGESWHCMPFDDTGYIWDTNLFSLSNYLKGSLLLISHSFSSDFPITYAPITFLPYSLLLSKFIETIY